MFRSIVSKILTYSLCVGLICGNSPSDQWSVDEPVAAFSEETQISSGGMEAQDADVSSGDMEAQCKDVSAGNPVQPEDTGTDELQVFDAEGDSSGIGLNVERHTQAEIKAFLKKKGAKISDAVTFSKEPSFTPPYQAGALSSQTLKSALNMLNQIRYIAGLSYDVTMDDEHNKQAQAAAMVNHANGTLSHYPQKPDGMSDELYQLGAEGAKSSNLAFTSWTCSLNAMQVQQWMDDGDPYNIGSLGHRVWMLNPAMQKAGFGWVKRDGSYSALYVLDYDREQDTSNVRVAWPAQNMPVSYFDRAFPWSVSCDGLYDINKIKVVLTRRSDKQKWVFSTSNHAGPFYVNYDIIIFRPETPQISYNPGDVFDVRITNGGEAIIEYTVAFFDENSDAQDPNEPKVPTEFTVTFDANGGSKVEKAVVDPGDKVKEPEAPTREGYVFKGWFTDAACTKLYDFANTSVEKDLKLYAGWERTGDAVCSVRFDLGGHGEDPEKYSGSYTVRFGDRIPQPESPRETGCIFGGWYKDRSYKEKWDFDGDTVNEDTVLYARWTIIDSDSGVAPEDVGSIKEGLWIEGVDRYTYAGEPIKPEPRVYFGSKRLIKGEDYTLSYLNNTKAASADDGKKAPKVTVKGKGAFAGQTSLKFTIEPLAVSANDIVAAKTYEAGRKYYPAIVHNGNILKENKDYTISYETSAGASLAKQPTSPGEYVMRFRGRGNCTGELALPFSVAEKGSIDIRNGKAQVRPMTYAEQAEPETSLKLGGKELVRGTDYNVWYYKIDKKGTAAAIFIGTGDYSGVIRKTFAVKACSIQEAQIRMDPSAVYHKGGAVPDFSLVLNGRELQYNRDYTVSYKNNNRLATATATFKGKENYTGSVKETFEVNPCEINDSMKILVSDALKGKAPKIAVYDANGKLLSSGTDYRARIDKSAGKVTVSGGKNGLYAGSVEIPYETAYTENLISSVQINTKAAGYDRDYNVYTGNEVVLSKKFLTVKAGSKVLQEDCYKITYVNNRKPGTAAAVIQGVNGYKGIKIVKFTVKRRPL